MPRISTDNYDTVASWNGSQDLFIVEQPDGTKVATPAMVKQFMQAGDFEATGEVKDGHGNILKDMAKSADVDAEIGDLSQTGLTGDSVAAQLTTAKGQIANLAAKYVSERLSKGSSTTIAAGNYVRVDIPCTKSGYTAIGILEVLGPDTAGALSLMQFSISSDGSLVFVYFANNTSSAKTMSDVRVRVLYRKN